MPSFSDVPKQEVQEYPHPIGSPATVEHGGKPSQYVVECPYRPCEFRRVFDSYSEASSAARQHAEDYNAKFAAEHGIDREGPQSQLDVLT